jgi:hypothetical protein
MTEEKEILSDIPVDSVDVLEIAQGKSEVTFRDDQEELHFFLDMVKFCRKKKIRFRLIDTGRFPVDQVERIVSEGGDLYTSDEAERDILELELFRKSSRRGKSIIAYFHYSDLSLESEKKSLTVPDLYQLGLTGTYLHFANKGTERDLSQLGQLAFGCQKGGGWLVYYHHGPLEQSLKELAENGAWIHISDRSLKEAEDIPLLLEVIKSSQTAGANLVLYLDKGMKFSALDDVVGSDAVVLFNSGLIDYKSPLKNLEKRARKEIDFRAFYLYPMLLP